MEGRGNKEGTKEGKNGREREKKEEGKKERYYLGLQHGTFTWIDLLVLGFHKEFSHLYYSDILAKQTRVTLWAECFVEIAEDRLTSFWEGSLV